MKKLIVNIFSVAVLVAVTSTEVVAREWTYPPPQGEYTKGPGPYQGPGKYAGPGRYNSGQGVYTTPRHYEGPGRYNSGQGEYTTPRHYAGPGPYTNGPGRYTQGPRHYHTPRHYTHRHYGSMSCRTWRGDWCPVWIPVRYPNVIVLDVPAGYYVSRGCSGGLVGLICVTVKGVGKALDWVLFGAFDSPEEERATITNACGGEVPCKVVCEDTNKNGRSEPNECRKLIE